MGRGNKLFFNVISDNNCGGNKESEGKLGGRKLSHFFRLNGQERLYEEVTFN